MNSDRLMRPTDQQLELFKNTFSDNQESLKTIRKAFLELPLTDNEKDSLTYLFKDNEPLQKAIRLMFLPELDGDMPLGQNMDLYMTVEIENLPPDFVHLVLKARAQLIELLEQGLANLLTPVESDKFTYRLTGDAEADFIWLKARNTFITHIDQSLLQIKFLSGKKSETVEETKTRLAKDSGK